MDRYTSCIQEHVHIINLLFVTHLQESSYCYWPREVGKEMVYGRLKVRLGEENSCGDIVERKMSVDHSKSSSKLTVNMVQLISWPKQGLPHPSAITSLIERLTNILRTCYSKQTVVMCRSENTNRK